MRANKGCLLRACSSEGVSPRHSCSAETQSRWRGGKALRWEGGAAPSPCPLEAAGRRVRSWLSLAGPELGAGVRVRDAVSCSSCPGHVGPVAGGGIAWPPGCCQFLRVCPTARGSLGVTVGAGRLPWAGCCRLWARGLPWYVVLAFSLLSYSVLVCK